MISNVLEHAPRGKKVSEADILARPAANTAQELERVMVRGEARERERRRTRENMNKWLKSDGQFLRQQY